jgi:hypothetical protein
MKVSRLSMFSGEINEMEIPITPQELVLIENRKVTIQQIAPTLTPEQREFLMTGVTPEEWNGGLPSEE